jgi:hypothetical protein
MLAVIGIRHLILVAAVVDGNLGKQTYRNASKYQYSTHRTIQEDMFVLSV